MAVDRPFPSGIFKVNLGPGTRDVTVLFKPTQSTIVFSIMTDPTEGILAQDYRIHHTRAGHFGHFDETAVVKAARELALQLVAKGRPR